MKKSGKQFAERFHVAESAQKFAAFLKSPGGAVVLVVAACVIAAGLLTGLLVTGLHRQNDSLVGQTALINTVSSQQSAGAEPNGSSSAAVSSSDSTVTSGLVSGSTSSSGSQRILGAGSSSAAGNTGGSAQTGQGAVSQANQGTGSAASAVGGSPAATDNSKSSANANAITLTGYLNDEDCYAQRVDPSTGKFRGGAGYADPGDDAITCLRMQVCLNSGDGIIVPQSDGTWKFYYFDGNFATGKGSAFTPPTSGQLLAYNFIQKTTKTDHIKVTVTGTLGGTRTNTNAIYPAYRDGVQYPVITISSLTDAG